MENNLYIIWDNDKKLGIPIIDEQHRGIISTINSLYYFIQNGHGTHVIKPTMIMLVQYTIIHFETEEELMKKAGYSIIEEHIKMHEHLLKKTKALSVEAVINKDPEMVLRFLKQWWLGHINKEDKKYALQVKKILTSS